MTDSTTGDDDTTGTSLSGASLTGMVDDGTTGDTIDPSMSGSITAASVSSSSGGSSSTSVGSSAGGSLTGVDDGIEPITDTDGPCLEGRC